MRLLSLRCSPVDAEVVADRCWSAGASGLWESEQDGQVVLRVGVDDDALDGFLVATADLAPRDVTETEAWVGAPRDVVVDVGGRSVPLVVPATVFGDGDHPTTAACLDAVWARSGPGVRVLDVGCGSGALAVAAALAGATATAVDVDPDAVAATVANAAANGVVVDASTTPLADVAGRFDLVAANISAGTLLELLPDLLDRVADGGALVVSGILSARWPEVVAAAGVPVEDRTEVDGWVTAVLRP